jgi:hypothetical protein
LLSKIFNCYPSAASDGFLGVTAALALAGFVTNGELQALEVGRAHALGEHGKVRRGVDLRTLDGEAGNLAIEERRNERRDLVALGGESAP